MAKMGRPKSKFPKLKTVGIRLSNEEYEELKKYAFAHNLTMTETLLKGMRMLFQAS